ncbi:MULTISPECIES: sulfatase [Sphingobacterium]|uniref:sulfatase family protein n=1 Tax=Sphingobacterium TaxID=28453 RepID=UPI0013DD5ADB|nr:MULTISPECIES: sulfatase [unclassified Sphingobacterium]
MKKYIVLFFMMLTFGSAFCQRVPVNIKPNIIIVFTDDQGYADLGCYGAKGFTTPNIDQLASNGIRFTDFYVPAPVCTPSRAGLMTGQYPKRNDLHEGVICPYSENGLSPEAYTIAEMLKDNGYETSCIGKWHLGHKEEFMPNNQGFDEFYGVPYSNDMDRHYYGHNNFQSPPLPFYRNKEVLESGPDQDYLTQRYTEEAVRQIRNRGADRPFFMYIAHNMPHTPLHASPEFRGKSELGLYGDVIMELDWSVGEIVKTLKEEGIYDNTIFIFTSDNGPKKGSALPLRGMKAQTWEGGQRVPGIITWPAKIPEGIVNDQMVSTLDLFPTLAKIAGARLSRNLELDGLDITDFLLNPAIETLPDRPFYFFATNGELESVRYGKWKLHIKKSLGWNKAKEGDFTPALYNLELDIQEKNNLVGEYPEVVNELTALIKNVGF